MKFDYLASIQDWLIHGGFRSLLREVIAEAIVDALREYDAEKLKGEG